LLDENCGVVRILFGEEVATLHRLSLRAWSPLPPDFVKFCGVLCGRDFVRKNLRNWQLRPSAAGEFGVSIVDASESSRIPPEKREVVGDTCRFNLLRNRAVLSYSADCNDYSPEHPIMCLELGRAYL
jgi:hypothetical protein